MKRLKIEWSKKSKHLGSPGSLQIPSMIDGKICRQIRASKPGALQAHLRGSARWGAGSLPDLVRGQVRTRQRWDAQWLPGWYFMIFYDICQVWRTRPFSVCHIIACVDSCHWFNVLVHIILWYTVICIRYNLHRISIDIPYIYMHVVTLYTQLISYHIICHCITHFIFLQYILQRLPGICSMVLAISLVPAPTIWQASLTEASLQMTVRQQSSDWVPAFSAWGAHEGQQTHE